MAAVTPILRIFDTEKAREFYIDFLGFEVVFEHRYGEEFPLYMGIRREGVDLHLSEHHGDAAPGAHVRIAVTGLADWTVRLRAANYRYARPGEPRATPWGTTEITITDPFANRLTFVETAG
ncbi:glyoxalase superfamily protein [Acuticoccus mangrovi]|uniref:Bleomycin resistance protein n=1 Tax=Acuticoccus mangrovi TaxID=2796142 RepID=A0A934MI16_9HYPH|nr:glyoxalase superfamily protein [Acuticoccus mangrovi]MBJ3777475.1 VOC family protein [Acuticoccus mangrovi]